MRWIDSCDCPFCGDELWECEHLVLDLGGGGEDGGVGLRASGGLQTQPEMLAALLDLIAYAWGEDEAPPVEEGVVLARLASISSRLPFGSEEWWCGGLGSVERLADEVLPETHGVATKTEFMGYQGPADGEPYEGGLLEDLWIHVVRRALEDVPDLTLGDCDIMSMTAGLYYLVWAEDPAAAEQAIAASISSMATAICEAVADASTGETNDA